MKTRPYFNWRFDRLAVFVLASASALAIVTQQAGPVLCALIVVLNLGLVAAFRLRPRRDRAIRRLHQIQLSGLKA